MHPSTIPSERKPYRSCSMVAKSSSTGYRVKPPRWLFAHLKAEDSRHPVDFQRLLQDLDARPIGRYTTRNLERIWARIEGPTALGAITLE